MPRSNPFWSALAATAATLLFCADESFAQSPSATSSRGVAPHFAWFDATNLTCAGFSGCDDPYTDLTYEWDFADPGAGVWQHSGQSKNAASGPLAFHVFEQPGSYRVELSVSRGSQTPRTYSIDVQVQNPDSVFGGGATRCVANAAGRFQGCPLDTDSDGTCELSPQNCIVSSNASANIPESSGRTLFRRGDSFSAQGEIRFADNGPVLVSSFGTGARPVFNRSGGGDVFRGSSTTDVRIVGIEVRCADSSCSAVDIGPRASRVLMMDNKVTGSSGAFMFPCGAHFENCSQIAYVGNTVMNPRGRYGAFGAATYLASMGNHFESSNKAFSHIIRHSSWRKAVVQHNLLSGGSGHGMKLHAHAGTGANRSAYIDISHNQIRRTDYWMLALLPEDNHEPVQEITNCIVDHNRLSELNTNAAIYTSCSHSVFRNNIIDISGFRGARGIHVDWRSRIANAPVPFDLLIERNTVYCSQCERNAKCLSVDVARDVTFRNNLCYAKGGSLAEVSGSVQGLSSENNLSDQQGEITSNPFVSSSPSVNDPASFQVEEGSSAAGVGAVLPGSAPPAGGDPDPTPPAPGVPQLIDVQRVD